MGGGGAAALHFSFVLLHLHPLVALQICLSVTSLQESNGVGGDWDGGGAAASSEGGGGDGVGGGGGAPAGKGRVGDGDSNGGGVALRTKLQRCSRLARLAADRRIATPAWGRPHFY